MKSRIAVLLASLILLTACLPIPNSLVSPAPEVGSAAPDFHASDLKGSVVTLSELRGQFVLINFWATWCAPCRVEMPVIQARYNDGGFAVLAVNFDESAEKVQGFVDELGLDLPVLLDPGGAVQELYRVRGYPTTYFVDGQGVIQYIHIGEMREGELDNYLALIGVQP